MQITTERLEDCQVNVIVELDAAEIDKKLRQTARTMSRQYTVPGYRRGKAPLAAVIRAFGREMVQQQAFEDFGQELYEQALEEVEYERFEAGELQDVEWDPFRMTILLPIEPELDLGEYRSVRAAYQVEAVTDERIGEYLAELQQENTQWVPVERPAALGDQIVVDLEGKAGDELIMSNEDYEMLLEEEATYPLPGFHEEIVGMSPGEEKTFVLVVPEDDDAVDAAGQEATVTARLHTVKEQEIPPLDDELAMTVGDYDTLDDLNAGVRVQLETEALQKAESEYLDQALDAFIDAAVKIEYPPQAIGREVELALNQMEGNLASSGIQLDTYLGMIGKTRDMYKEELRPAAEARLKKRLVLDEIARQEDLQVDPEEVDAEIQRISETLGSQADEMLQTLQSAGGHLMVADDLKTGKAQQRAVEIAKGEAEARVELESEVEVEEEAEVEAEAEAEAEAEVKVEEETEAEVEVETEAVVEVEADAAAEVEAETEAMVQVETEAEGKEAVPETTVEGEG